MKLKKVYTYGVFDLFHRGHIELLQEARELGDYLIVGLFTDEISRSFKRSPIIPFDDRIEMLKACKFVDEVIIQDEFLPDKNIYLVKPDILAKGDGAGWEEGAIPPGTEAMKKVGGTVVKLSYHQGISTSDIIKKITSKKNICIVSNNLLLKTGMRFDREIVVRINVAWVKTIHEITGIINNVEHDIYLDYPQGRTKPPKPIININDAINIANKYDKVKFFAVSNVEDPEKILEIKNKLRADIQLVPKIETPLGVENLELIIKYIDCSYIMLDKEDLYVSVDKNIDTFEQYVTDTRNKCKNLHVHCLELQGVFFS